MAFKNENFDAAATLLRRLPNGVWFNLPPNSKKIDFQAPDRAAFREIRGAFPGLTWEKSWSNECAWWTFTTTTEDGWELHVYGCHEGPPSCRAIVETRKVKEKIPLTYEEREVERQVIVGWDCA